MANKFETKVTQNLPSEIKTSGNNARSAAEAIVDNDPDAPDELVTDAQGSTPEETVNAFSTDDFIFAHQMIMAVRAGQFGQGDERIQALMDIDFDERSARDIVSKADEG